MIQANRLCRSFSDRRDARGVHAYKQRALDPGAVAYIQKPWADEELLAIIANFLPASGLARAAEAVDYASHHC